MKKLLLLIVVTLAFHYSFAAFSVEVKESAELLSIVCRLAEYREYVNDNIKSYTEEIDSYFAPHKTSPLIDYAKAIRKQGIGYDAVASLIPFMEIKNKKILFPQDAFETISQNDQRWNVDTLSKFAVLLNDFYKKTNFNRFFSKHSSLYEITKTKFNETITNQLNLSWFDNIFGVSNTNFHIVLSLCNGTSNYGPSNEKDDYYAILGVSRTDSLGLPFFDDNNIPVVIHEFNHSYCNPICRKYKDRLLPVFDTLFPYVAKTLIERAYGSSETLMYENLTRLSTLWYLSDQEVLGVDHVIRDEQSGFPWMYYLLSFYNNFENNRDIYPDFESFIPEYIQFMKGIAGQIEEIIAEYENKVPRVVSVFPPNGSTVSSQIKEARIVFNLPMRDAHGARPLDEDSENRKLFLRPMGVSLSPNKRTIIFPINLEANTKYGCILPTFFRSEEGYDATKEYECTFDTK
jgi:hypothetical protein